MHFSWFTPSLAQAPHTNPLVYRPQRGAAGAPPFWGGGGDGTCTWLMAAELEPAAPRPLTAPSTWDSFPFRRLKLSTMLLNRLIRKVNAGRRGGGRVARDSIMGEWVEIKIARVGQKIAISKRTRRRGLIMVRGGMGNGPVVGWVEIEGARVKGTPRDFRGHPGGRSAHTEPYISWLRAPNRSSLSSPV